MAIQFLLGYWRVLLIATLFGLLSLQTWRLDRANREMLLYEERAKIAQQQTENNLEHLQASIPRMVEQVKINAWANAKSRFGTCPVAGGIRADSVLSYAGSGQDAGNARDDAAGPELVAVGKPFINDCALDAGFLDKWIETCRANPMICEVKGD